MNMVYAIQNESEVISSVQDDFGQKDYEREMASREAIKAKSKADYDKAIAEGQVLPPYVEPTFPEYITKLEQWKQGKETITQTAVEHDGVIVRDNSILKVVDGVIEYDADAVAGKEKEALRKQYKTERDEALYSATVEVDGMLFQTRPTDFANFEVGIAEGSTEWILADNSIGEVTTAQLQQAFELGKSQAKDIYDACIMKLKTL